MDEADKKPLASPGNFFPGGKSRVAELFPESLGRSFLAFSHFAAVDHHITRVALSRDLDLAEFHQSCFHISVFCSLSIRQETRILRLSGALILSPVRGRLTLRTVSVEECAQRVKVAHFWRVDRPSNVTEFDPSKYSYWTRWLSPGMRKDRYRSDNEDRRKDYATVAIEFLRSLPVLISF